MSDVFKIFTTDDKKELKDTIKEVCLKQIKEDIKDVYLVNADDMRCLYQELFEELKDELRTEIKEEYGELIKQSIIKSIKDKL